MKRLNKDHMEQLIKEAISEEIESSPPPPLSTIEAWEKLNHRLNKSNINSMRISFFKKKWIYAASVLLLVAFIMFLSPKSGEAYSKITEIFKNVRGTVVQLFIKVGNGPKQDINAPTSEDFSIVQGSEIISEQTSLEMAQKKTSFTIKVPQNIPEEFVLKNVTVSKREKELSKDIFLNYVGDQRGFIINQKLIGDSFGSGITADSDDTQVEQVTVHGQKASLLRYKNGVLELIWVIQDYYFSISGKLSKDEVIKIAESI